MTGRTSATPAVPSGIGGSAAPEPARAAQWRARLDALTRWCLSELPLAPAVADALPAARPTLGDLLRRALSRDGCGVVDLLDALDAAATPEARALLARVLGSDLLLVVVTARDGAVTRADARACRTPDEARALVNAFFGAPAPAWVAEFGAADAAGLRTPALAWGIDGPLLGATSAAALSQNEAGEITIVLPFLPLDGRSVAVAPAPPPRPDIEPADPFAMPAILGGTMRPGAAFLDAPPAVLVDDADAPDAERRGRDSDDEEGGREADDEDERSDESDDEASHDSAADAFADSADEFLAAFAPLPDARAGASDAGTDEDHATGVDHGGALDRLRARTSAAVQRVSVLIATDDGVAEHVADAAAWLADASEQELRALARAGWTGDAAAEVALALADDDPEALDVVQLARRHEAELVVEIDGREAAAWLATHRPDAARRLGTLLQ